MSGWSASAFIVGSYLVGSISFAYILVRQLRGIDLRTVGSGNLGATNAGRVLGRKLGILIYFLDFLKGFAPVAIAKEALGDPSLPGSLSIPVSLAAGFAAFLGHCYPLWHQFKGGKGVATASGLILALAPLVGIATLAVFGLVLAIFRMVSLGSIVASIALPLLFWAWNRETAFARPKSWTLALFVFVSVWVVIRHRKNVSRIVSGQEPKIGGKRA